MSKPATMGRALLAPAGALLAAHFVPSVVSLGQWTRLRALPGGLCRWRGPAGPRIALTFDDGPRPATTPLVLDRLDQLGLVGTFFCLGTMAARHPDLLAEVVGRGHQVETHGYRHDHHFVRTPGWVRADLAAAVDTMGAAGIRPRWFRPPYGQTAGATMVEAHRQGLSLVLWSSWGREWAEPDAAHVARRVISGLGEGAIVLLHDAEDSSPPGSCRRAIDALGPIADHLDRRGWNAVTLDDLVSPAP